MLKGKSISYVCEGAFSEGYDGRMPRYHYVAFSQTTSEATCTFMVPRIVEWVCLPPIGFSLYHITAVTTGVVLAAVLTTVVTATLVTPPVLTAVTTACHDGPSWRVVCQRLNSRTSGGYGVRLMLLLAGFLKLFIKLLGAAACSNWGCPARYIQVSHRYVFWATVSKTVRPMLSGRFPVMSVLYWCIVAKRLDGSRRNLACR